MYTQAKQFLQKWWLSIVFNVSLIILVFSVGYIITCNYMGTTYIMLIFTIAKLAMKRAEHYKWWVRCAFFTTALFSSLFLIANVDLLLSILLTILSAFMITKNADINTVAMCDLTISVQPIKLKPRIRKMFNQQVKPVIEEVLEKLPTDEAVVVRAIDYEKKTVQYTADVVSFCSPEKVIELQQRAYVRLNELYE